MENFWKNHPYLGMMIQFDQKYVSKWVAKNQQLAILIRASTFIQGWKVYMDLG